jgi:hypothetical protein
MLLPDLGMGLLRRWYFVVLGVLLTMGGAFLLTALVPPTYQATARIVLIPPTSLVTAGGNPYLFLGGLEQALGVLTVRLGSEAVGEQVLQGHTGGSYLAEKDSMSPGPIMLITAEGESPESTLQVLDSVIKVLPENLEGMQNQLNIPASSRITAMTIVRENEPKMVVKSQLRAVLAGVAAGLSLTVLATGLLDRLLSSRRRNAGRRHASDLGDEPIVLPAPETVEHKQDSRSRIRLRRGLSGELPATENRPSTPKYEKEELPTMTSNK